MTTQPTWEPGPQTGVPTLVPLLSQLPLEFPPKPTIRKAVWLHFLELHKEPVFSAPTTLKVCRRSKTRLMKEKQEGMKTHSTSGLQSKVCLYVPRPQTHFLLKNECASNSLENGEPLFPK